MSFVYLKRKEYNMAKKIVKKSGKKASVSPKKPVKSATKKPDKSKAKKVEKKTLTAKPSKKVAPKKIAAKKIAAKKVLVKKVSPVVKAKEVKKPLTLLKKENSVKGKNDKGFSGKKEKAKKSKPSLEELDGEGLEMVGEIENLELETDVIEDDDLVEDTEIKVKPKTGKRRRGKRHNDEENYDSENLIRQSVVKIDMTKSLVRKSKGAEPKPFVNTSDNRSRYNDSELTEFKELLLGKLKEAETDYELLKSTLSNKDNHGTDDTSPTFKLLEDGSEVMSKEETAQLASRQEKYIVSLRNALIRIENKSYGVCRVTGKLIPKERLRSVPHATLGIDAKLNQSNK